MKYRFLLGLILVIVAFAGTILINGVSAQDVETIDQTSLQPETPDVAVFTENFNYTAGALLTANGWTAHSSGGTNPIAVSAPGLTYSGYSASGVGNGVSLTTSGEDVNRTFPAQSTGTVYAGVLVNVSEATTDAAGDYLFHLGPDPISTTFRGRLYVRRDANNMLAFGITKSATSAAVTPVFTPFSYALNTTHLLVVKYAIVDGATNDTVSLIVNPTLGGAEPAASATAPDTSATDITPASVALRQGSTATSPTLRADGIRIGTAWADLSGSGTAVNDAYCDFDGDGRTDYVTIREQSGAQRWYIQFANLSGFQITWGLISDNVTPGDFDGDGRDDVAVWRARTGDPVSQWGFYVFQSSNNTARFYRFGQPNDQTQGLVADYDGDGRDDPAIYRSGTSASVQSVFWWLSSTQNGIYPPNSQFPVNWGSVNDRPIAAGDYTGDGRADFAIIRSTAPQNSPSNLVFWIHPNSGSGDAFANNIITRFGVANANGNDEVVTGDFDGDGRADIAVVRRGGGEIRWFYQPSGNPSISSVQRVWGASSDDAVSGDYDGDGRADLATWRSGALDPAFPITGPTFYVLGTMTGPSERIFGLPTDQLAAARSVEATFPE